MRIKETLSLFHVKERMALPKVSKVEVSDTLDLTKIKKWLKPFAQNIVKKTRILCDFYVEVQRLQFHDWTIMKASKIISTPNRNGSIDMTMSKVKQFKFHNGWKKWKEKKTQSDSNKKRSFREIFFKRAFYETLMVNSKVDSKVN